MGSGHCLLRFDLCFHSVLSNWCGVFHHYFLMQYCGFGWFFWFSFILQHEWIKLNSSHNSLCAFVFRCPKHSRRLMSYLLHLLLSICTVSPTSIGFLTWINVVFLKNIVNNISSDRNNLDTDPFIQSFTAPPALCVRAGISSSWVKSNQVKFNLQIRLSLYEWTEQSQGFVLRSFTVHDWQVW